MSIHLSRRAMLAFGSAAMVASSGAFFWDEGGPQAAPLPFRPVGPAQMSALSSEDRQAYALFRDRFIAADGRVIDTHNACVSHTEGQGWGMLMAVAFNDPKTFDRVYTWTRRNLRRSSDHLHAWRYQPNAKIAVADQNNATDGDLYIAGALARGARLWKRPDLEADANAIGRDILRLLVRRVGDRTVLLPGVSGFERDGVVVNLSYYAFPMMREIARVTPSLLWASLEDDGLKLIEDGRFGTWKLPPDWLLIDRSTGQLSPAPGWPARFSYDAIRIPLNLAWVRAGSAATNQAFETYWIGPHPFAPAWVDLRDGTIASYPAEAGTRAIAETVVRTRKQDGRRTKQPMPVAGAKDEYYSAALVVLSRIALNDATATA